MENRVFHLPPQDSETATFKVKYIATQKQLKSIAAADDLLSGTYTSTCECTCRNLITSLSVQDVYMTLHR